MEVAEEMDMREVVLVIEESGVLATRYAVSFKFG